MAKKVVKKVSKDLKLDAGLVAYIFGILSIVQAFISPLSGVVLGIIGLVFSKKENTSLAKTAKKLNTIGIVVGAIVMVLAVLAQYFVLPSLGSI